MHRLKTNHGSKVFGEKKSVSAEHVQAFFPFHCSLNKIIKELFTWYLHCVRYFKSRRSDSMYSGGGMQVIREYQVILHETLSIPGLWCQLLRGLRGTVLTIVLCPGILGK